MKILLLHVTGLHIGHIGCYGNDWVSTPALDQLATESVVFDQHYADCLGLWPTAWTGHYRYPWLATDALSTPPDLGDILAAKDIPLINVTEAQLTAAAHVNPESYHDEIRQALQSALAGVDAQPSWLIALELPSLLPPWLVGEEFLLHYFQPEEKEKQKDKDTEAEDDSEDEGELPAEEASDSPGILWPLLDPPLGPIDIDDDELLQRLQLTYAAAVSQTDAYLYTALETVRQAANDDLLVIVTTDRGLALGEHGVVGDAIGRLHEELVHLPLLIRLPQGEQAGRRIAALTQPVDLFATILEALGLAAPEHHGHSLLPLARGEMAQVRDYAVCGFHMDQETEWVLRTPDWSLLLPGDDSGRRIQLFAKPEDRWEVNDLRQQYLDLAEGLEQTLRAWGKAATQPGLLHPPPLPQPEAEPE